MYVTRLDQFNRSCGYVVDGRVADVLVDSEDCQCTDLMVRDGCYQCWQCGTIYGLVYGWARAPKRSHWRSSPR